MPPPFIVKCPQPRFLGLVVSLLAATPLQASIRLQAAPTVRDSSGVRIVDHGTLHAALAPFRIVDSAVLDLGGLRADPREEIYSRIPFLIARPLSDGRWVIADRSALKVFDSRGRYIRTIGGPGAGPGEFRQVRDACIAPGDTIVGVALEGRLVVFDSSGAHVRTTVIPGQFRRDPCFSDGSVIVGRDAGIANPPQGVSQDRLHWVRWDGSERGSFGPVPVESMDRSVPQLANVVARGERVYVGNGVDTEYRVYSNRGALLLIVRWRATRIRVTTEMRAAAIRGGYRASPVAREFMPAYFLIRVGTDHSVWVQDNVAGAAGWRWFTVFDRNGALVGRVVLPTALSDLTNGRVELLWAERDRVVLGWRDSDGAPHLTVHALIGR
jgi:hypothetical protein